MSRLIDKLYGDNNAETPVKHVFDIQKSDMEVAYWMANDCLEKSETREEFEKSWSSDLQKKFPQGGWRTINGARVFINGGKVIAGLGGFNKQIDEFFEGKKGNGKLQERTDKLLKEYYNKDKGVKEKVVKRGISESTAKIEVKKRGNDFSVKPDELEKDKFKVVHNVKGDAEGMTFEQYKDKYEKQLEVTAKNQLEYESQQQGQKEGSIKDRISQNAAKVNLQEIIDNGGEKRFANPKAVADKINKYTDKKVIATDVTVKLDKNDLITKDSKSIRISEETRPYKDNKNAKWVRVEYTDKNGNTRIYGGAVDLYGSKEKTIDAALSSINSYQSIQDKKQQDKGENKKEDSLEELKKQNPKESEFIDWLFKQYDNPKEAAITYAAKPYVLSGMRKKFEEGKVKKESSKQNKVYKEAESFGKKKLDNENPEHIKSLYVAASTIDPKYLSKETKGKMDQLIEDIYVNSYVDNDKPLYESTSLKDSLNVLSKESVKMDKKGEYAIDQKTIDNIQDFIVSALKEQANKITTEKKNYKLF